MIPLPDRCEQTAQTGIGVTAKKAERVVQVFIRASGAAQVTL